MTIGENYIRIAEKVASECESCGRAPDAALLLAVSKTVDLDGVQAAIDVGARDFGENRPDEIVRKHAAFPQVNWHFIGNIQSRRIKDIVPCAYLIHSLYEPHHAKKISEEAQKIGKVQNVLLEVNVSGELSKSGLRPIDVPEMLKVCAELPGLKVCGFMTMAPQGDAHIAQECFAKLAELANTAAQSVSVADIGSIAGYPSTAESANAKSHPRQFQLSMGMSEDWREAIAEGSTIVRIGRAIFSEQFN